MSPSKTPLGNLLQRCACHLFTSVSRYPFFSCCCPIRSNRGSFRKRRAFPVSFGVATLNFRAFVHEVQLSPQVAPSSRPHSPLLLYQCTHSTLCSAPFESTQETSGFSQSECLSQAEWE